MSAGARETLDNRAVVSLLIETNQNLRDHMSTVSRRNALGFRHDPARVVRAGRKDGSFQGMAETFFTR